MLHHDVREKVVARDTAVFIRSLAEHQIRLCVRTVPCVSAGPEAGGFNEYGCGLMFAPKNFLFSVDDCAVAAENMMLAADALGIGSCYIGQGWTAFADPYGQKILRQWSIPTDHYAVMQLLLGYPRAGDKHPAPKPRKEGRIIRVRGVEE